LEDFVNKVASINSVGDLYSTGRVKLSQNHVVGINFNGLGLVDINFLENFPELRSLNLNTNSIKDISVLSKLNKLNKLEMKKNYVSDLSPLGNLNSLNYLDMEMNDITNLAPLRNLENLQEVYLSSNKILDIMYLEKSSLVRLDVRDNCLFPGADYSFFENRLQNTFLIDSYMGPSCANQQEVRNFIYSYLQGLSGKYSIEENKKFVDALHNEGLLTDKEFKDIKGTSWGGLTKEKEMNYVQELFYNKFIRK
jgi:hypothetical protein